MEILTRPNVSIIIPTYKDWNRLQLCVDALLSQTYPQDQFEVIIVNNDLEAGLPNNFTLPSSYKLIHQPKPGSYSCRNAALTIARGSIVGFTDSDCIPETNWIERAVDYFNNERVDRVAGNVKIFYRSAHSKTWPELYENVFAFDQKRNVEVLKASVTANLFVRKACFDIVGNFDDTKKSGEDFGWNRRANAKGFSLIYAPEVSVSHPARYTFKELSDKRKRVFGGHKIFNDKRYLKKMIYPAILCYNYFVFPLQRLYKSDALGLADKLRVSWILFCLFLVTELEYFRLLSGKTPKR